jgi:hypothetical protein
LGPAGVSANPCTENIKRNPPSYSVKQVGSRYPSPLMQYQNIFNL